MASEEQASLLKAEPAQPQPREVLELDWLTDWILKSGPPPACALLLLHALAVLLLLRGAALAACAPPLLAVLGYSLFRQRQRQPQGKDGWLAAALAPQEDDAIGPHAVATAWLVGGLLSVDLEVRLLCGVCLAGAPGLPRWKVTAFMTVWLARAAMMAGGGLLRAGSSGPLVVLLLSFVGQFLELISDRQRKRDNPKLPALALVGLQGAGFPGGEPRLATGFERAVKCFPNWSPPSHKEVRVWTKLFSLREELLAVYACSVPAKLLHSGSLYISLGHVCFYGVAIITHSMNFKLALDEIKEVRHGGSRDVATLVLKRPLLMKGRKDHVTSVELRGCEAGSAAIAALVTRGDAPDEDDESSELEEESPGTMKHARSNAPPSVFADGEPFQTLFDVRVLRLELPILAEELLTSNWGEGTLIRDKIAGQGATEVCISPWIEGAGEAETPGCSVKIREVTSRIPVPPAPMCPRSTRVTTTFRISVSAEGNITIESSGVSHDVPFGDKFLVQERVELEPLPDGKGAHATQSGRCVFIKSCGMLQSRIKASAMAGVGRAGEQLVTLLNQRASKALEGFERSDSKETPTPKVICSLQIWELQRRTTILHSDWRAPFLPHDGKRRWRWVDASYQKHPWTTAVFREEAANALTPPVHPRDGWEPLGDWEVQTEGGDIEGWQYASDYHRGDRFWSKNKTGHHVRRRLWKRSFMEIEGAEHVSAFTTAPDLPHGTSMMSGSSN